MDILLAIGCCYVGYKMLPLLVSWSNVLGFAILVIFFCMNINEAIEFSRKRFFKEE